MPESQGLIIVYTGYGKGKTTAALGLGMRAWGQGLKVLVLQFMKRNWRYGELQAAERIGPDFVIRQLDEMVSNCEDETVLTDHHSLANYIFQKAKTEILSQKWDMIILDEINYAVKIGLVSLDTALELMTIKPPPLHLVLTGRGAAKAIIDKADLVTAMIEIKYPYKQDSKVQKALSFTAE
jgi:cob(I)alamin adenosyltransferase